MPRVAQGPCVACDLLTGIDGCPLGWQTALLSAGAAHESLWRTATAVARRRRPTYPAWERPGGGIRRVRPGPTATREDHMRLGLFYQIQVPKPWTPQSESQRIYEALEQIPYAEQMGFASVWFSEHHFRPVWSHNSAPDLTLAAVSQRTSRIRLGIGVVLAPIHHPLHVAARMATLDILSHGRVDVGLGRTGYPYQLTPYGADLHDTRGMWQEFAAVYQDALQTAPVSGAVPPCRTALMTAG